MIGDLLFVKCVILYIQLSVFRGIAMKVNRKNGLDNGTPASTKLFLAVIFILLTVICSFAMMQTVTFEGLRQKYAYCIGFSALLSGLLTAVLYTCLPTQRFRTPQVDAAYYPLISGILGLLAMALGYIWIGVWPFGRESLMIVDMHHQYAPLLAQLREMVLNGGSPLYTFETGVGANFISLFAYYLASPFNLLLALLPESMLTEGVLVITLLKNAIAAAMFAACVQYVFRRRDFSVVILSLGYSLSMYMIAYSWNIMWLDGVMLLPLVILGFERMMRESKYGVYVLTLAYILFTNYYIGFMVCVFLVLYFFMYVIRSHHDGKAFFRAGLRFALASLIGGGLAMCILLPVVFALQYTSAAGETLPDFKATFALFRVPAQQLFGMVPTIRSGNLPNIFCGILPVVLVPLLLTTKTIPLRRRLAYGGLVGALALSFTVNVFDLIWHGLHTPNDLPYRFSFLYVFAVLLAAAAMLPHLKDITDKQLGGTFAVIVGYIVLYEALQGNEAQVFTPVYVTLLLVAAYCGVILLIKYGKLAVRSGYTVLAAICILEMTVSGGISFEALNGNEYYTDRASYIDNEEHRAAANAVNKLEELADAAENGSFYRAEFLPMRTCVDTALYHYRGLTSFSSSNYYHTTRLLGYLGYADNGVNSYLYHSFVPASDALLNLKYIALQDDVNHPYLEKIGTESTGSYTYYLYRNRLALPIAFRASANTSDFVAAMYDPFATQEALYTALTGDDRPLYTFAPINVSYNSADNASTHGDTRFNCEGEGEATFEVAIESTAAYYIFVDCTAAKSGWISIYDANGGSVASYDASLNEAYIIDAGTLPEGCSVYVTISADMAVSGNIFVASLDNTVLEEKIAVLQKDGMTVTAFSDHRISGTLNAGENGTVFTSIPYDASWTVTVDGKKVDTYPVGDLNEDGSQGAFLCFDVALGNHDITFSYMPKGLKAGLLASAVSLVAFILLLLITRKKKTIPTVQTVAPAAPAPKRKEETPADVLSDDITLGDLLDDTPAEIPEQ